MILASVTTCPERWMHYRKLRREFDSLHLPCALRTFQTGEHAGNPRLNANLNARAALSYAQRHLPDDDRSWLLYLEDDVRLDPALPEMLGYLVEAAVHQRVDCWYLCNRKNPIRVRFRHGPIAVAELGEPIAGSHGLLIPRRHLGRLLASDWRAYADNAVFGCFEALGARIWQVLDPVLVRHVGEYSTFDPLTKRTLEINHANSSDLDPAGGTHCDRIVS